jgi:hypothetical protein
MQQDMELLGLRSLLACLVPQCATRHGAPKSQLNNQKGQGHPTRGNVYTDQTKQRFGYEETNRIACHSVQMY